MLVFGNEQLRCGSLKMKLCIKKDPILKFIILKSISYFIQGNIYTEQFIHIWENKFESMRFRNWTKTGYCLNCHHYNNCNGGAMHLWNEKNKIAFLHA
jgi:radical SAM protein with 4Fe4S-binding SPASM domain